MYGGRVGGGWVVGDVVFVGRDVLGHPRCGGTSTSISLHGEANAGSSR